MQSSVEFSTSSRAQQFLVQLAKVLLLCLLVLVIGWEILTNATVNNLLVSFIFAGIVPGTHIILSPNTVLYAVAASLGGGSLLLMTRSLRRSARARQILAGETVVPAITAAETISPKAQRWSLYQWLVTKAAQTPTEISLLQSQASIAYTVLRRYSLMSLIVLVEVSSALWAIGKKFAVLTWKQLEPKLRQLDSWLARELHKRTKAISKHLQRQHDLVFLLQLMRQIKASGLWSVLLHSDGTKDGTDGRTPELSGLLSGEHVGDAHKTGT